MADEDSPGRSSLISRTFGLAKSQHDPSALFLTGAGVSRQRELVGRQKMAGAPRKSRSLFEPTADEHDNSLPGLLVALLTIFDTDGTQHGRHVRLAPSSRPPARAQVHEAWREAEKERVLGVLRGAGHEWILSALGDVLPALLPDTSSLYPRRAGRDFRPALRATGLRAGACAVGCTIQ